MTYRGVNYHRARKRKEKGKIVREYDKSRGRTPTKKQSYPDPVPYKHVSKPIALLQVPNSDGLGSHIEKVLGRGNTLNIGATKRDKAIYKRKQQIKLERRRAKRVIKQQENGR